MSDSPLPRSPLSPHPNPLPQGEGVRGEGVREVQFQSPLAPRERGLGGEGAFHLQQTNLASEGAISQLAGINRHIPEALLQRARELRQQQTPAEKLLWQCLRNRQLLNAKFRRQHNIGRYIADFYCHEARLVIELDGSIHQTRKTEDSIRDDWMQKNGFTVLRFTNQEVFNETERVLYAIADTLNTSTSHTDTSYKGNELNKI
jgi:very-short-patch-repair endonuclease